MSEMVKFIEEMTDEEIEQALVELSAPTWLDAAEDFGWKLGLPRPRARYIGTLSRTDRKHQLYAEREQRPRREAPREASKEAA